MEFSHVSVLLNETIEQLHIRPDGIYVDGTLGGGGHAYEVCRRLGEGGRLIGIDQDADAIAAAGERLKEFGRRKRVVMDGRDIGTTVFPDAELKIFMVADTLVRAQRRAGEMAARGEKVDLEEVLRNIEERDYIDSHRETSPLSRAEDAIVLDNSRMTLEEQMEWFRQLVSEKFPLKS